jgi:hypothetical protein
MMAEEVLARLSKLGVVVFANGDGLEFVRSGEQGRVPTRLAKEAQLSHDEIKALLNRPAKGATAV